MVQSRILFRFCETRLNGSKLDHLTRRRDFCTTEFFSFSRGAKFGEFRPTVPAQVVCGSPVGEWQWGEME
jgi:hypothetical protein